GRLGRIAARVPTRASSRSIEATAIVRAAFEPALTLIVRGASALPRGARAEFTARVRERAEFARRKRPLMNQRGLMGYDGLREERTDVPHAAGREHDARRGSNQDPA